MPASPRLHAPLLLVCDIQEKFSQAIHAFDSVVATTSKLLDASDILGIPIAASTQSAAKLGDTVAALRLNERKHLKLVRDKTLFSMYDPDDAELMALLDEGGAREGGAGAGAGAARRKRDVLLVGIETHICVTQTALDLLQAGHRVFVMSDGVSSCNREEKPVALARLASEGVTVTTSESVVYEIMRDAKIAGFRDVAKLVKESKQATVRALADLHW